MNAKNIFRNIRGLAMSALLLIPAAFVSCSDDDTEAAAPTSGWRIPSYRASW